MTKANFGTALENIVSLDLTDAAFVPNSTALKEKYAVELGNMIEALKGQESTLRLNYNSNLDLNGVVGNRLSELAIQIQDLWEAYGSDYDLNIEKKTTQSTEQHASHIGGKE